MNDTYPANHSRELRTTLRNAFRRAFRKLLGGRMILLAADSFSL